jgi:hypothetical protein
VAIFPDFEHVADYLATRTTVYGQGGYDLATTRRMLATGQRDLADKAERMLETIETESVYADNVPTWGRAVAGGFPDVPTYLAGVPTNMRRRVPQQGLAPLTIVVETFMSGGIDDAGRVRRGVAILALVRKLTMTGHAVDLWLAHTSRPACTATCLIRVESRPLDLARAVWGFVASFASDGFKSASAEVLYNLAKSDTGSLSSPFGDGDFPNNPEKLTAYYAPILQAQNALMAIPGSRGDGASFNSDAGARQWLDAKYKQACELARNQIAA